MFQRATVLTAAAALLVPVVVAAVPASAAGDRHGPGRTAVEVVASGLDTPRGLTWDAWGNRVLVTEAGRGGPAPCAPGVGDYPACFGLTGAVTAYSPRSGRATRIAEGLPSVINEFSVLGLHDVAVDRGRVLVVFGLGGRMSTRDGLGAEARGLGQTGVVTPGGDLVPRGDLLAFEQTHNPHKADVNTNAYGIVPVPGGALVAEAGGNNILFAGDDGTVRMVALLPDQVIGDTVVESVPSAITRGPDGAFYISEYSGEPTRIGAARVWRLVPGRTPTVVARGFTGIIDMTFDNRGRMLILELAEKGFDSPDRTGRLIRVERDGTRTVLAREGLEHPGGVAVAPNGDIYLTNRTTGMGDNSGQLLRLRATR
ncbi:ScyD/ScyE family protein [Saccharothrix sp. BKS2]|uniref:ScyD/ScyE family protein n=1 Tax=Saccharothrix sp. BKS2 TaxID=3064400 RepID=UPI0039E7B7CB